MEIDCQLYLQSHKILAWSHMWLIGSGMPTPDYVAFHKNNVYVTVPGKTHHMGIFAKIEIALYISSTT